MGKRNRSSFNKRAIEIKKRQKAEDKRARRLAKKNNTESVGEPLVSDPTELPDESEIAHSTVPDGPANESESRAND